MFGAFTSEHAGKIVWLIGIVTAFMTAYYTFRIIDRTFLSPPADPKAAEHAHESPNVMITPLTVLAFLSLVGGFVGIPGYSVIGKFLEPMFPAAHHEGAASLEIILTAIALAVAAAGIFVAYFVQLKRPGIAERLANEQPFTSRLHRLSLNKFYVDEIYDALIVRPIRWFSEKILWRIIDVNIIDGIVNDVGEFLRGAGGVFRGFQTGDARTYAAAILLGTLGLIAYFVWMVK